MSKRKYTHIKGLEKQIVSMREVGMTRQEIADELGLEKEQIKNWVARYNRRKAGLLQGLPATPKGHPRKMQLATEEDYARTIARLQMENKLLRDFLQSTEWLYLSMIRDLIDRYIYFYNYERIQNKTGVAPLTLQTGAVQNEDGIFYLPVDPKPPDARSVSSNSRTSV